MITIFKNIKNTSAPYHRDIGVVLDRIKKGSSRELVESIRTENDKTKRNLLKQQLPSICFSGKFNQRSDKAIEFHSGYICLDFDGYDDDETMLTHKDSYADDDYVYSVFVSPSGKGLKVIVRIPPIIENHVKYFNSLKDHFDSEYFDVTSRNLSRVCYESYDADIIVNPESKVWDVISNDDDLILEKKSLKNIIPITDSNKIVDILLSWWNKKYGLVSGQRNNNLFILCAALNDFGIDKIDAASVVFQFQSSDFPSNEIKTTLDSAYSHTEKFGTKCYEDVEATNKIKDSLVSGKQKKDIRSDLEASGVGGDVIDAAIELAEEEVAEKKFWSINDRGSISIIPFMFRSFLENHGFYKFVPDGSRTFIFVKVTNNLIDDTTEYEIKNFVLDYLEKTKNLDVYNYFADKTRFFKDDYLSMLSSVKVHFVSDDKENAYLYYRNCAVRVTKDSVNIIDYIDLGGFVWRSHVIDRDFHDFYSDNCDYCMFISNVSGNKENTIASMRSTIGYLMHAYKNKSYCPAIILNDEVISDNPEGGTGKGLFMSALSKMKKTVVIDGKHINFDKSFAYQLISADTQLIVFDDVKKNFDFERLFSVVTEGITLEKKNKDAIKLSFDDSPKIAITTNYAIKGKGASFVRRKWDLEFKQYYSPIFTPHSDFGRLLFDDWDTEEWLKFDNYMVSNLMLYLANGLMKTDFVNQKIRQLSTETSHEFIEWCGLVKGFEKSPKLKLNTIIYKNELFNDFVSDNPDYGSHGNKKLSRIKFYSWLTTYGKSIVGHEPIDGRSTEGRWIEFVDGKKEEVKEDGVELDIKF